MGCSRKLSWNFSFFYFTPRNSRKTPPGNSICYSLIPLEIPFFHWISLGFFWTYFQRFSLTVSSANLGNSCAGDNSSWFVCGTFGQSCPDFWKKFFFNILLPMSYLDYWFDYLDIFFLVFPVGKRLSSLVNRSSKFLFW